MKSPARDEADDLVVVHLVPSGAEVEIPLSVLRAEGIKCGSRASNRAAGLGGGLSRWGPQEVLVSRRDEAAARELLSQDDPDN